MIFHAFAKSLPNNMSRNQSNKLESTHEQNTKKQRTISCNNEEPMAGDHVVPNLSKCFSKSFPTSSADSTKSTQLGRFKVNELSLPRTPRLLSVPSPYLTTYMKKSENNCIHVVPQTPFLKTIESPDIPGQIHRKNSGFQVPETPVVRLGAHNGNVATIVEETPLLPQINQ